MADQGKSGQARERLLDFNKGQAERICRCRERQRLADRRGATRAGAETPEGQRDRRGGRAAGRTGTGARSRGENRRGLTTCSGQCPGSRGRAAQQRAADQLSTAHRCSRRRPMRTPNARYGRPKPRNGRKCTPPQSKPPKPRRSITARCRWPPTRSWRPNDCAGIRIRQLSTEDGSAKPRSTQ